MPLRHVVFDIGNVLLDWDPRHLYGRLFPGKADQMEWFLRHVCTPSWNLEQDAGRSWAAGVGVLVASHPEWRAEIEAYDRRWHEMIPRVLDDTVAIMAELRAAGVRLFAITNFSSEKYLESFDLYGFLSWFEGVVVSGDERLIKPHAPIFALLMARYGLDPADCVFIDDNADNVAGAAAIGFTAIHFTGADALRPDLRAHGFPV